MSPKLCICLGTSTPVLGPFKVSQRLGGSRGSRPCLLAGQHRQRRPAGGHRAHVPFRRGGGRRNGVPKQRGQARALRPSAAHACAMEAWQEQRLPVPASAPCTSAGRQIDDPLHGRDQLFFLVYIRRFGSEFPHVLLSFLGAVSAAPLHSSHCLQPMQCLAWPLLLWKSTAFVAGSCRSSRFLSGCRR